MAERAHTQKQEVADTFYNHRLVRTVYSQEDRSLLALPFVVDTKQVGGRRRVDYWSVPPAPSYGDACDVGRQFAAEFVQWLLDNPRWAGTNSIGTFVQHMKAHPPGDARRGYQVGFWCALEKLLLVAATKVDHWAVLQADLDKFRLLREAAEAEEAAERATKAPKRRRNGEAGHG